MNETRTVLYAVIPVFLVIGGGVGMRKLNWLTEQADSSLLRITINVFMPCLAFDALLGNRAFQQAGNVLWPPLVGFGSVVLGLAAAGLVRRLVPARTPKTRPTFTYAVAIYNYGYVPLPLAASLFGKETVGVLFVHNVGIEVGFWVFGLLLLAGAGLRASSRRLINIPLLTILTTLTLNLFLPREAVPPFFMGAVKLLGQCAIPMGLVVIGATIADHAHEFVRAQGGRVMALGCLLRLGVLPLLFLTAARWLPVSVELKRVMVIQASMPAAVFPIVLARHYGGDVLTALRVVLATSALSLITIPLWLRFGLHFVGL